MQKNGNPRLARTADGAPVVECARPAIGPVNRFDCQYKGGSPGGPDRRRARRLRLGHRAAIRHLVDAPTTADPRYTPITTRREAHARDTQARYARWQTAYRALKQLRPQMSDVWYARQIAKLAGAAGCHASTIRKHMTGRPGASTRRG